MRKFTKQACMYCNADRDNASMQKFLIGFIWLEVSDLSRCTGTQRLSATEDPQARYRKRPVLSRVSPVCEKGIGHRRHIKEGLHQERSPVFRPLKRFQHLFYTIVSG